jgi:protein ImuA
MPDRSALAALRRHLEEAAVLRAPAMTGRVSFGLPALDAVVDGGLVRRALHELYAQGMASLPAATIVALGLAWRAAGERPILWVRQDPLDIEMGRPHSPGLAELGFDPGRVVLVRARDATAVLRAGAEAARCGALGAVLIEPWGEPRLLDLTASRRLALMAETSGVITLLLRVARPQASAARSRWLIEAHPSQAREANAPGDPAFRLRLLRHRGGSDQGEWRVEWDRDRRCFQPGAEAPATIRPGRNTDAPPLSRSVVAFPANGSAETPDLAATRRRVA